MKEECDNILNELKSEGISAIVSEQPTNLTKQITNYYHTGVRYIVVLNEDEFNKDGVIRIHKIGTEYTDVVYKTAYINHLKNMIP